MARVRAPHPRIEALADAMEKDCGDDGGVRRHPPVPLVILPHETRHGRAAPDSLPVQATDRSRALKSALRQPIGPPFRASPFRDQPRFRPGFSPRTRPPPPRGPERRSASTRPPPRWAWSFATTAAGRVLPVETPVPAAGKPAPALVAGDSATDGLQSTRRPASRARRRSGSSPTSTAAGSPPAARPAKSSTGPAGGRAASTASAPDRTRRGSRRSRAACARPLRALRARPRGPAPDPVLAFDVDAETAAAVRAVGGPAREADRSHGRAFPGRDF